jgi:hypothetical protein
MNYDFRISQTLDKAAKFGKLFRKIKLQFSLSPQDRDPPKTLIEYTCDRFDELDREKPFLRSGTASAWNQHLDEVRSNETLYDNIIRLPGELRQHSRGINLGNENKKNDKIGKWIASMV